MDTRTLFDLTSEMAAIEDALWENGGELTEELNLALTETGESLAKKVDSYNGLIRSFKFTSDAIAAEIARLTKRKKAADRAVENLKFKILEAMGNKFQRLDGTYCKMYKCRSEKVETDDAVILAPYIADLEELRGTLPSYITLPDLKVNKTCIKAMHKDFGEVPEGAAIVENYSLIIK